MVKLKNIRIDDNIACCDIYPEDSKTNGTLEVNIKNEDILKYSLPEGFEWCSNHLYHAKDALVKMVSEQEIPKEKTIMWY